jgi:hypothetical protein
MLRPGKGHVNEGDDLGIISQYLAKNLDTTQNALVEVLSVIDSMTMSAPTPE